MKRILPESSNQQQSEEEVAELQRQIERDFLATAVAAREPNFVRIAAADLDQMFRLYDHYFFQGRIGECLSANQISFSTRLSPRMTDAGGKTVFNLLADQNGGRKQMEIVLSTTLLFESFQVDSKAHFVAGLKCESRVEAMQRILEHEIVHLIELNDRGDSSCSRSPFKHIAQRLFRHRQSHHQLLRPVDRAREKYNIRIGDRVRFQFEGRVVCGIVKRITKRATILVPATPGVVSFGRRLRYLKYYVPINQLQKCA